MQRSIKKRFFPIPDFLATPSYGLDISDESLKFVEFKNSPTGIKLGNFGERKIPSGVIDSGRIMDAAKIEEILVTLRREEGLEYVRVSLPEEQVYIVQLSLDKESLQDIRSGIELLLEEHIPIPIEETVFDYEILSVEQKVLTVQVAAISRNTVDEYLSVFERASINVLSLELEAQAISRAVVKNGDLETYMIVDFGEKRTGIFIVTNNKVAFTSTLEFGGVTVTQMIQKDFNISFDEAEKIKKEYGLQRNLENKEIFPVLLNGISVLRDEISKHLLYWNSHKGEEGKQHPPVKKIILCGGNANITGLSDYFSVSLKSKVEIANVWLNTTCGFEDEIIPKIDFQVSLSFATAIGLALGDFYND